MTEEADLLRLKVDIYMRRVSRARAANSACPGAVSPDELDRLDLELIEAQLEAVRHGLNRYGYSPEPPSPPTPPGPF